MIEFSQSLLFVCLIIGILYVIFGLKLSKLVLRLVIVFNAIAISLLISLVPWLSTNPLGSLSALALYSPMDLLYDFGGRIALALLIGLVIGIIIASVQFKLGVFISQIFANIAAFVLSYILGQHGGRELMTLAFVLLFIPISIETMVLIFFQKYYLFVFALVFGGINLGLGLMGQVTIFASSPLLAFLGSFIVMAIGLAIQARIWPESMFLSSNDYYREQLSKIREDYRQDPEERGPVFERRNSNLDFPNDRFKYHIADEDFEDDIYYGDRETIKEDKYPYDDFQERRTYEKEINQQFKSYLFEDFGKIIDSMSNNNVLKDSSIGKSYDLLRSDPIFRPLVKYGNFIGLAYIILLVINLFRKSPSLDIFSMSFGLILIFIMLVGKDFKTGLVLNIGLLIYNIIIFIKKISGGHILDQIVRLIFIGFLLYFLYLFVNSIKVDKETH